MLYRRAMPMADILCLTEIDDTPGQADAFFPEYTEREWEVIEDNRYRKDEKHAHDYRFVTYIKR